MALAPGSVIEVPVESTLGHVAGTALFAILGSDNADNRGQFLNGNYAGCSSPGCEIALDGLFSQPQQPAVIHICRGPKGQCGAAYSGCQVFHVDTMCKRAANGITELWARRAALPQPPQTGLPGLTDGGGAIDSVTKALVADKLKKAKDDLKLRASQRRCWSEDAVGSSRFFPGQEEE